MQLRLDILRVQLRIRVSLSVGVGLVGMGVVVEKHHFIRLRVIHLQIVEQQVKIDLRFLLVEVAIIVQK